MEMNGKRKKMNFPRERHESYLESAARETKTSKTRNYPSFATDSFVFTNSFVQIVGFFLFLNEISNMSFFVVNVIVYISYADNKTNG